MDLTHLRYFKSISEEGSMTAAARALGVSQPTLTVAMKNLEERLNTTLFLRERSGVKLTRTGEELLRHVNEVFAILNRAEEEILGLETDDIGTFIIGCHESLGAYFLPGFMSTFLKEVPSIEISLMNDSSANVQRAVVERRSHFGLVVNPVPHLDVVSVPMFHDAVDLFISTDIEFSVESRRLRPGTRASSIPPPLTAPKQDFDTVAQWLRAGPLIFAGRVAQCRDLIDRLAADHLLPTRLLSCGDFELVKSLALAGIGIAILPRRVAAYGHEGKLRRLHPSLPNFPDTISLIYRADMHRTKAAMRVKDALIAYGKRLDQEHPV